MGENDYSFDLGFGPQPEIILLTDSLQLCSDAAGTLVVQIANILPTYNVLFVLV
jgi:hypothetical protein